MTFFTHLSPDCSCLDEASAGALEQNFLQCAPQCRAREVSAKRNVLPSPYGIVGQSAPIHALRDQISLYANTPFPVLIEGETGSGKELVAAALHRLGTPRAPYQAVNCAAISPALLESTLFGYCKGAFTGATHAKSGFFEDAANGTLFLGKR